MLYGGEMNAAKACSNLDVMYEGVQDYHTGYGYLYVLEIPVY